MAYRIIKGILIGACFAGVTLAIVGYFATINSNSGGGFMLGSERDLWKLAVVVDFLFGAFLGGFTGAVIAGFNWNFTLALFFSGSLNLLIVGVCFFLGNGVISDSITYSLYSLIPIGLFNGAIVSLTTHVKSAIE